MSRGKVDVFVTIEALEDAAAEVKINHSLADGYVKALRELRDTYGLQDDISVSTVARYGDIFSIHKGDVYKRQPGTRRSSISPACC